METTSVGCVGNGPLEARVTRCTGRACHGRSVGAQSGVEERAASHGETWVWGQTDVDTGRVRSDVFRTRVPRKYRGVQYSP